MDKKHIMVVSGLIPPQVSGAGKRALRTAIEVSKHHNVTLVSRTKDADVSIPQLVIFPELDLPKGKQGRILNNIINISVLPLVVFYTLNKIKQKPDILHLYSVNWFSIYVILFNLWIWKSKIFTEITLMGSDTLNSTNRWWLYRKLTNFCIKKSSHINCISPQLYDYMKDLGCDEQKMSIIPNSLDEKYLNISFKNKSDLRSKFGLNTEDFIISTVGGITKRKGYFFIQEILKHLPASYPIKIIAVGSYKLENQKKIVSEIQYNLQETGKKDRLIFVGYADPLPYLLLSDMFLFVSTREGFGSAIIEAMACGLTVLVKKIDKITDYIIINEKTGVIMDSDDPVAFANRIISMYKDAQQGKMGIMARESVVKRFSMQVIIKEYLEMYARLFQNGQKQTNNNLK